MRWTQPKLVHLFQQTSDNSASAKETFEATLIKSCAEGTLCIMTTIAELAGLTQDSHKFHIHTYGDLRSDDTISLGGRFSNPTNAELLHCFSYHARLHSSFCIPAT